MWALLLLATIYVVLLGIVLAVLYAHGERERELEDQRAGRDK